MTVSQADIQRMRRMVNEPTDQTYNDTLIISYISSWPLLDDNGKKFGEDDWTEAYDLHAAAADIWEEKASTYHDKHDFSADNSSFSASQMFTNAMSMVRFHRARQKPTSKKIIKSPLDNLLGNDLGGGLFANIDPLEDDWREFWKDL